MKYQCESEERFLSREKKRWDKEMELEEKSRREDKSTSCT